MVMSKMSIVTLSDGYDCGYGYGYGYDGQCDQWSPLRYGGDHHLHLNLSLI
jgi:hypothetical protein